MSFLFEISITHINWGSAAAGWVTPAFPNGGMLVIMSVLGAVVMPHNLFLHSEIIQSRQWNLQDEAVINKQLKYEFSDTLVSMMIGWAIISAMILMAAVTFFTTKTPVTDLIQAEQMLKTLIALTSSKKAMGKYANSKAGKIILWAIGLVVTFLNIALLINLFW